MKKVSVVVDAFEEKDEIKAHSSFSASGAERWQKCPGSVNLSKNVPDKDSPWALEGTRAHGVLERILVSAIHQEATHVEKVFAYSFPNDMVEHCRSAANIILDLWAKSPESDIEVENRITLDFIHPEMFGTYDSAIVDHFGTLNVFDFKFGAGYAVSPERNLQMIFYGLGLAHNHHWNFKRVRLWIIQPRIRGYDGPVFWELPIAELKKYVKTFRTAVENVLENPDVFVEGSHCKWCKGMFKCPLKRQTRDDRAQQIFSANPVEKPERKKYGKEEKSYEEKELDQWYKKRSQKEKVKDRAESKAKDEVLDFF